MVRGPARKPGQGPDVVANRGQPRGSATVAVPGAMTFPESLSVQISRSTIVSPSSSRIAVTLPCAVTIWPLFLLEDIAHFQIGGAFSMVLSTYNAMNHLDSEEKIRGCFRSVRACLAEGARFVFDFHTLGGLREWANPESARWEQDQVEAQGEFDRLRGTAVMRLRGEVEGKTFEEKIVNYSYPLVQLDQWLTREGFHDVRFSRMDELLSPLEEPEKENRVVVVAG